MVDSEIKYTVSRVPGHEKKTHSVFSSVFCSIPCFSHVRPTIQSEGGWKPVLLLQLLVSASLVPSPTPSFMSLGVGLGTRLCIRSSAVSFGYEHLTGI